MRFPKALFLISTFSILTLVGCSNSNQNGALKLFESNYFSMRNQTAMPYYGIVQLKSPALLATAKTVDGKLVVDAELKKQILKEQDEFIQSLKSAAPKVEIIAKYRMVLNAVSILAPGEDVKKIEKLLGVTKIEEHALFDRPQVFADKKFKAPSIADKNSVTFIGAEEAYRRGHTGKNLKIGVIDTGVDFTHAMMGGPGTEEAYKSVDPTAQTDLFPNKKVVGGIDVVGDSYNPRTEDTRYSVPRRDNNPLDISGHGTHVAGTIAGIGDGQNTYNGVAPDADIYAIKVFGREGGTSSLAVISALEYSADPSEQITPERRLDVVNLSLGGSYGKPNVLYTEAIKNLTKAGTIVVASAGNSGDNPYIVGAPSTSDEAISVAASIDDMSHNVDFPAVEVLVGEENILEEAIEGPISRPIATSEVKSELVYIGNGASEIPLELQLKVRGKIALIDRGVNSFVDKLTLAEKLGAVGVVVLNNQPGRPLVMGGTGFVDLPAVMLTFETGNKIKNALKNNSEILFNFSPDKRIVKTELIDTITSFSSRGPRSLDSLIKPEIAGPGENIISAQHATGNKGVMFSGTSMSGPHIAGVVGLLRQAQPKMSVREIKTILLNNSKIMEQKDKGIIPVSLQGAGRVQVAESLKAKVLAMPATLSLGEVPVNKKKTQTMKVTLKNFSSEDVSFQTKVSKRTAVEVIVPKSVTVKSGEEKIVNVTFVLSPIENSESTSIEVDGFVSFESHEQKINLPFLAVLNKLSVIKLSGKVVAEEHDSELADVKLNLTNLGANSGLVLPFNLLGSDARKQVMREGNLSENLNCDLEVAGYRILETENGKVLEFGIKFYDTLTFWQPCDVSVQFDHNGDGQTDQELIGILGNYISGLSGGAQSILLDAKMARSIRKEFELALGTNKPIEENYSPALMGTMPFTFFDHSTISVLRVSLDKIIKGEDQTVTIKLASMNFESDGQTDDFLADHESKWASLNLSNNASAFLELEEAIEVAPGKTEELIFKRGYGQGQLLLLMPQNAPVYKATLKDQQSLIF